jgi:PAS domain S-box-containing protein
VTGGLYFVAGMIGLLVPFTTNNVSPIWPASGIALASLFVFGWRCWPAVTVAAFLVNYISLLSPFAAIGLALGNTAACLAGYFLLRRIPGFQPALSRLQDLLGLIAFAAVLSSTISASFGCIVFSALGIKPWGSLGASWLMYYLGDAMGVLLAAPVLLSLEDVARRHKFRRIAELGCLLFMLATTCVLLFAERINVGAHHTALTLLVFPFVLWAAIRFGILGTALANGVIASLSVIETAHGFGPFSKNLPLTNALLLQLFLATVAISGLLLAAVIAEQKSIEAARRKVVREKAAQEAKQESEKRYRLIVELASEGIWTLDGEHRTTFVNHQFAQMLGYGPEEMLGKPPEAFCLDTLPRLERALYVNEFRLKRKDGAVLWAGLSATRISDEQKGTHEILVMVTDINERKRAEEQILKSRTELQGILDNSPALIYMKDLAGRYLFVNRSWTELYDTTVDLVQGKTDFELFPEEAARQFVANDQRVMESPQALDFEEETAFQNGVRYYHSVKVALRISEGKFYALCGISTDISERKRAEEALRQTNRALRVLSHCNSAVVHATEEQALLNEVCRVAVGPAGYKLAWVGYADHDEACTVRPVASAGPSEGFLGRVRVSWADNQYGRGAIGPAIREGRAVVIRHVLDHPAFAIWHDLFEMRKFGSLLALPLRHEDSVFGALTVYAEEPEAFNPTEVDLLTELSDNLAHGILSLRARAERAEAVAALERSRLELEERVRDRTAELVEAKEAAESADRLKSTFLATMSHELRTPLNSIIGFTGIVSQGMAGPLNPEQTKQLTIVKNSARHLLDLINDVLDISKIEAGQLEIQCEEFSLPRAIEKVVAIVSPLANKKRIVLHTEISPEVGSIMSDQRRTEQILLNLMGNAVKFTDEGSVVVRCWMENERLVTAITDTGIGIDPQHQKSIFEPFRQADTGLARKREGTGLGLSICKRLVEALGGVISVESAPGQGSTFTVQLPMERDKTHE